MFATRLGVFHPLERPFPESNPGRRSGSLWLHPGTRSLLCEPPVISRWTGVKSWLLATPLGLRNAESRVEGVEDGRQPQGNALADVQVWGRVAVAAAKFKL